MHDLDLHGISHLNNRSKTHVLQFKPNEQKIIAKLAVFSDSLIFLSAKNRYSINWGDGESLNYKSEVIAIHKYSFDKLNVPIHPSGYKEVTITITPQKNYNLTEINFDPQDETIIVNENEQIAKWISINGVLPKLNSFILSSGKTKNRHPLLKSFSIRT